MAKNKSMIQHLYDRAGMQNKPPVVGPKTKRQAIKAKKQENKVALKNERMQAKAAVKQERANIKQERINAKLNMTPAQLKQKRQERVAKIGGLAATAGVVVAKEIRNVREQRGRERYDSQYHEAHPGRYPNSYPSNRELRKLGRKK